MLRLVLALVLAATAARAATPGQALLLLGGNGAPSLNLDFRTGVLPTGVTLTRASSGTYFDATGVLQTAGTNVARFDHNPVTHAALGLLLEGFPVTNLLLNSATLATQGATVTAQAYVLSFYGTGTAALSGTCAGSLVGTGAFPARASLVFTPSAGTCTVTVTGSVLDAQLEAGYAPTSWMPTTGSTATRAADIVPNLPIGAWYNPRMGTLAVEWALEELGGIYGAATAFVGANSGTDFIMPYATTGTGPSPQISAAGIVVSTVNQCCTLPQYTGAVLTPGVVQENAFAWRIGASPPQVWNGILNTNAQPAISATPVIAALMIGSTVHYQNPSAVWLRRIRYWPRTAGPGELLGDAP